jgi:hypothetical protein
MTYEITDRTEFKDKFAALLASNVSLIAAGLEPSRDLSSQMINEFLNQFTIATPAPAIPLTAGYVVVCNQTGYIPGDFRGQLLETHWDADRAIKNWIVKTGRGKASAYGSREVTYFG